MKRCNKCGVEYSDDIKFCPKCGSEVIKIPHLQTYAVHCKSCNGTMAVDDERPVLVCPFCGSKELIVESDAVTVERIKQKTHRDIEMGKQQLERERMEHADKVAQEQKKATEIRKFRKSFMGVMLIIVGALSVLFCAVSFNDGRILSGLLAIVIGVLCIASYLMGIQVVKEKFKGMRIISAVLAFVLVIPYFSLYDSGAPSYEDKPENFEWTILEMHEYIPEPPSTYGTIGLDYFNHMSIDIYNVSYAEYKEYRNQCIEMGYDKNTSGGGDTYYAYNSENFNLNLFYYKDDKKLGIILLAPKEETTTTKGTKTTEPTDPPTTVTTTITTTTTKTTKTTKTTTTTTKTTTTTTTAAPTSKYEKAFIRDMSNYDLYYMFDEDAKEVVYFGTNDTYVQEGIYSGDFSTGVDINWVNDGWHETFVCKIGSSYATLTDGNGYEWDYEICDIDEAQDILDSMR